MLADQAAQAFYLEKRLPVGRYTYRYRVDGRYCVDPLSPTNGQLGAPGFDEPDKIRNLVRPAPRARAPPAHASHARPAIGAAWEANGGGFSCRPRLRHVVLFSLWDLHPPAASAPPYPR